MKLMVFDGNSIINRAYYAIRALSTSSGQSTNGIFGFLKLFFKYYNMCSPDMAAVAFDLKEKTFRHELFDQYKAQRKGMPDELASQLEPLKEILRAMDICILEKVGYEADDIIGTLSQFCNEKGYECDIVSGDRDDFQLISPLVRLIMPVTRGGMSEVDIVDEKALFDKYGLKPHQMIDLKSIMGDSSDNIKGVAGIGEKGALELIKNFGSLEGVYDNLDSPLIKKSVREKLIENKDMAFLSYKLAKICTSVPIDIDEQSLKINKLDSSKLLPVLEKYELNSIIKDLNLKPEPKYINAPDIQTANLKEIAADVKDKLYFVMQDDVFYVCTDSGVKRTDDIFPLITNDKLQKYTYDAKPVYAQMLKRGLTIAKPFYDCKVAQYVLDPSRNDYSMSHLIQEYIGSEPEPSCNEAAVFTERLKEIVEKQYSIIEQNGQHGLLYDIEFALTIVLADMEHTGFCIDTDKMAEYRDMLSEHIEALEKSIYELAGEKFNINSPKQLGVILFEKLGLKPTKKTKTGYSTNAEALAKLGGKHEIVDLILEYRQYVKLKTTYCDGLLSLVDKDNRIHTSFMQTVTQTGRISSVEPNLQNIPVRTELGSELRKMFIAGDGKLLVDADYSQIELRVLAHIANDKNMLKAFKDDMDIHTVTAATVFGVDTKMVTAEMRRKAKAVNFGIVYGISDFSLAKDIGVTKAEAKRYIDNYLDNYNGVKQYMHDIVAKAKEDGFVISLTGRRRYLPELKSKNYVIRSFGERVALNTPIQGTAADIIKIAMVRVYNELNKRGMKSKLILQVHDELIVESPDNERDAAMEILETQMQHAMQLNVLLKADASCGKSWYDCK